VPLKEVQSVEGQTVEMTCELSRPGQTVTWLKDGVELQPDERCAVVVDGCTHRLTIQNASLEDEAEYTVRLTDDVSSKATLWVEGMYPLPRNHPRDTRQHTPFQRPVLFSSLQVAEPSVTPCVSKSLSFWFCSLPRVTLKH